jgi:hypothetical protein
MSSYKKQRSNDESEKYTGEYVHMPIRMVSWATLTSCHVTSCRTIAAVSLGHSGWRVAIRLFFPSRLPSSNGSHIVIGVLPAIESVDLLTPVGPMTTTSKVEFRAWTEIVDRSTEHISFFAIDPDYAEWFVWPTNIGNGKALEHQDVPHHYPLGLEVLFISLARHRPGGLWAR